MKNWRTISKDKYIIAGVITFLIFSLGITLGLVLENYRYSLVEDINKEQEVKYLSLQLQYLYLSSLNNQNNCPILATALQETIGDLSDSLGEVIAYEENDNANSMSNKRKISVQRRYILDNLRYFLLAKESRKQCNLKIIPILYFYAEDCSSCPTQGTILSFYKKIYGEKLLVFPINIDLRSEEPMVEIVMKQFNVTKYPTLIIEGKKYEGVVQNEQMQNIICETLPELAECNTK